ARRHERRPQAPGIDSGRSAGRAALRVIGRSEGGVARPARPGQHPVADGNTLVILPFMKTAISLPDEVFERATRYGKKLGISRSELFSRAVQQFLDEHRAREVRESYDRAFGVASSQPNSDDTAELRRLATRRALLDVEW